MKKEIKIKVNENEDDLFDYTDEVEHKFPFLENKKIKRVFRYKSDEFIIEIDGLFYLLYPATHYTGCNIVLRKIKPKKRLIKRMEEETK